jgi:transposase
VSSSRVVTSTEGFAVGLGRWARRGLKAAVEASGITPWICQLLKELGVKVVVVNPNRVRLIAESRKKADRVGCRDFGGAVATGWVA